MTHWGHVWSFRDTCGITHSRFHMWIHSVCLFFSICPPWWMSVFHVIQRWLFQFRHSSERMFIEIRNCHSPPAVTQANVYASRSFFILAVNTELLQTALHMPCSCATVSLRRCACVSEEREKMATFGRPPLSLTGVSRPFWLCSKQRIFANLTPIFGLRHRATFWPPASRLCVV